MKRFIVCLAFITITATAVNAQLIRGAGIKVGATFSKQNWDYSSSGDTEKYDRTGLNLGGFIEFFDNPLLTLVTEINYVQKGITRETEIPIPGPNPVVSTDKRIDYLNLAALGKVRLNLGLVEPYVLAGPKIDFELTKENEQDIENNFQKGRWGLKVGVGSEINLLPLNLFAEILYDADFNELYDNQNLKIETNSVDLRIGILF